MSIKNYQRGDTIIEVLFAITVFSLVAVGGLSIMNQGTAMAQRSLETTLVRQQIDAQADLIRFAHAVYVNNPEGDTAAAQTWRDIKDSQVDSLPTFGGESCPDEVTNSFVVQKSTSGDNNIQLTDLGTIEPAAVYSKVNTARVDGQDASQGLWVQSVKIDARDSSVASDAYDIHIRACWYGPGSNVPATIGTIVRLYEPTN